MPWSTIRVLFSVFLSLLINSWDYHLNRTFIRPFFFCVVGIHGVLGIILYNKLNDLIDRSIDKYYVVQLNDGINLANSQNKTKNRKKKKIKFIYPLMQQQLK